MKTGVFFHKEFTNKDWPIIGDKFHNFPMVMERALLLPDVLHVCFWSYSNTIENETKVDVEVREKTADGEYLEKVHSEFFTRVREFKPFIIFHNLGHDTAQGDYGEIGLTRSFFKPCPDSKELC